MSGDLFLGRSVEEIEELKEALADTEATGRGSLHPDLPYEDGIRKTIGWLFEGGDHPYQGGKWRQEVEPSLNQESQKARNNRHHGKRAKIGRFLQTGEIFSLVF